VSEFIEDFLELIENAALPVVNLIPDWLFTWATCLIERVALPDLHQDLCAIHSRTT
jgi:hypothetical protein